MKNFVNKTASESGYEGRFYFLEAARGFAVLWIVLFHFLSMREGFDPPLKSFFQLGDRGVQIFFVIAGFVIPLSVERTWARGQGAVDFLKKRVSRIYIPYLFSLVFAALVFPFMEALLTCVKDGLDLPTFLKYWDYYFPHYSIFEWLGLITLTKVFAIDSWALHEAFLPINGALWFIAILMQMYLVVAAAMLSKRFFYRILTAITLFSAALYFFSLKKFVPHGLFLIYWPQFAVGLGLFLLIKKQWFLRFSRPVFMAVMICYLIIGCLGAAGSDTKFYFSLWTGGLFWLIYPLDQTVSNLLPLRLLSKLGVFSYSVYLIHVPLQPILLMMNRNLYPWIPLHWGQLCIAAPLAFVFGYVWYCFFEKPACIQVFLTNFRHPFRCILNRK